MSSISIKFDVASTLPKIPLELTVLLDGKIVQSFDHVTQHTVEVAVDDSTEAEHVLSIEMSGKLSAHTEIDQDGNIVSDALIGISNFTLDDIEIQHLLVQHGIYCHNFNGSGNDTQDRFYGNMGCNGSLKLNFKTPAFLWLLENM